MKHIQDLPDALAGKDPGAFNMLIGLDGFVDEIVHMVDKRTDFENFTRIRTIADFGKRISQAAGLSTNVEMVSVQTKLGGNGPILSNALLEYGVGLSYVGCLGMPDIHPVFLPMSRKCNAVYSLCNPGFTDACEFEDGKIMLGKHSTLKNLTWDALKDGMGQAAGIAEKIDACHLVGMENWTMIPQMSRIWQGLIEEVFPLLAQKAVRPIAFFDLADPQKRTDADIRHAMELIGTFETRFRTVLGLNEKEAFDIAKVMGVGTDATDAAALKQVCLNLHKKLGIHCLVVHPVRSACAVIGGEFFYTDGPYCQAPKLTTGAGDNFNAGFCLGMVMDLPPILCLALGVCTSGFYVRNAKSPTLGEVADFAGKWGRGALEA